jgi:DNA-directed RNA polymerase beta' subunit
MLRLPSWIAGYYRPATDQEVRAQSFGLLTAPRNLDTEHWEGLRGTLEDQAIFGPERDFECACGKYKGRKYANMICDRCGVKLTTSAVRRERFGHIDLPGPILHPLGKNSELIGAIPVVPDMFVNSNRGEALLDIYDDLIRSVASKSASEIVAGFKQVLKLLLRPVIVAHQWNLQEREVLAHGLALTRRPRSGDHVCDSCGYPLEGLMAMVCPGCGTELSKIVS